jgi:hypothetical protein
MIDIFYDANHIYLMNFILCMIILVIGLNLYRKSEDRIFFFVPLAFGFFGLSHMLNLIGLGESLDALLVVIRYTGYMLVVYVLYLIVKGRAE